MKMNENTEKLKKKVSSLHLSLIFMTIIPMIILGIIVSLFVYNRFTRIMYDEVKEEMKNTALIIYNTYEYAFPGDYDSIGETKVAIVKGEKVLNGNYDIIDKVKEETDSDITLYYGNVRVITTINDNKGNRIIGTTARKLVENQVIKGEECRFYDNAIIDGKKYFSYYMPVFNSDNICCGMIAVSKPIEKVENKILEGIWPILLIAMAGIVLVGIISYRYSNYLIKRISKIHKFLKKTASGDFTVKIDEKVLEENDELSEMGKTAINMQRSLKNLVEQDVLTEINNRRYGDKFLLETQRQSIEKGTEFCVAVADIDFFKKINDTYGHECGDYVLKNIAGILKSNMLGKGFVARWGGEEFLLVFDRDNMKNACVVLEKIIDEIRKCKIVYGENVVNVTVTCGIAQGSDAPIHSIVKEADNKLYEGKQNGRNRIVK